MLIRSGRQGQPCLVPYNAGPRAVSLASQRVACRRLIALPRTRQPRPGRSRGLSVAVQKTNSATVNEKGIVVMLLPMAPFPIFRPPSFWALLCSQRCNASPQIDTADETPFNKILCANRGEIAVRVFRAGTECAITACLAARLSRHPPLDPAPGLPMHVKASHGPFADPRFELLADEPMSRSCVVKRTSRLQAGAPHAGDLQPGGPAAAAPLQGGRELPGRRPGDDPRAGVPGRRGA